jgi:hypothetical protein
VDIPLLFRLVNGGVQILVGEIRMFSLELVDQVEIGSMCRLVNDSLVGLCNYRHCEYHDWFIG